VSARTLEFLVPGDLQAGTGGYVYDRRIIEGLRARGWQVTVHALDGGLPGPSIAALERTDRVLAGLPDETLVIIDGLALSAISAALRAHATRLALVALMHRPLGSEEERRALQSVRHAVITGQSIHAVLCGQGMDPERISLVEPGTDPAPLTHRTAGEAVRLLCVANLLPDKGHERLIEALAPLARRCWQLTCVGSLTRSPVTVQRLRAQLQRTGLAERVALVGEVDAARVTHFYQDADVFVLATRFESYGMAVAEAVAHGLPVIGTRTGAIPELVGADAGIIVGPEDTGALREALALAIGDPRRRASWARGAAAARRALSDWTEAAARMAWVLEDVRRGGAV
jgi:glycosyltransferase involved in cell wall biosynthesis